MKKYFYYLSIALIFSLVFTSCQKEELTIDDKVNEQQVDGEISITKEVTNKLKLLNFNPEGIKIIENIKEDGSSEQAFLIEGDIIISPDQLNKMSDTNITSKQYRTSNLVSNNQTISVFGYNSGSYGLTTKQQNALVAAVNNYNSLNIGLDFTLIFGSSPSSQDIIVRQLSGNAGGVAGFPSSGNPYNMVTIYSGTESYSSAVNEHVLTHEIGHTLGLRHTDWFSRQSCGQSGEDAAPYGAVHIPGTPTGFDSNSLMLACFNSYESGNLGQYDIVALEYLYPLPQLSVTMSGPSKGNNSGTYTWTANVSNGSGSISYDWKYSYDGNNYNYSFGGNTQSVTNQLPLDKDLYVKVTVTSNGETASATKFTINMDSQF